MDAQEILGLAAATREGSMPFPQIVGRLVDNGVEYYHVDYVALQMSYYSASGEVIKTPVNYEGLPGVSADFNADALRMAILDSQQNGQHYRDFTTRAMRAGVQGYIAFLRGQRVTYWGRNGDQHIEWFPGAKPASA